MEKTIVLTLACLCLLTPSFAAIDFSKSFGKGSQASPEDAGVLNNIDPTKMTTYPPATDPRQFSYNINDGIEGALQIRHETWENGVVKGYYTYPLGEKMWQLVNYIADTQGYRITSTKALTEAELLKLGGDQKMNTGSANVQLEEDGLKTNYKINKNDINQNQDGKKTGAGPIPIPIQLKKARELAQAAELAEQLKEQLDKNEKDGGKSSQDEEKENETTDLKKDKDQKGKLSKKFPLKYQDAEV